jgi:putative hydrolase of the HAD superfamily
MLPEAFLLDLDDTILDDTGNAHACWRDACHAHAHALPDPDALLAGIRRVADHFWSDPERHRLGRLQLDLTRRNIVRQALADLGIDHVALADAVAQHYTDARWAGLKPLDEAIETVAWLKASGCRLALLTNGARAAQQRKIDRFGLDPYFDAILIEGAEGFGKPDPRVYQRALSLLGASPGRTWMAGDNLEWDVAAPQRAGITGIWVDVRGEGLPEGHPTRPDRIVRRISELRAS